MGYRFQFDGKIITYCPDTGVCENAILLAKNTDLLIAECSFKSGQSNPEWPHLNPEDAAQIAKEANANILVLTHFDANIYRTLKERKEAENIGKKIFQTTFAAMDNMRIQI
jgi:ribonuclease BN (tRNA processing enzyme)